MTQTHTFSMFFGEVIALWYQQDNQRLGQIFTDHLYRVGKAGIANSLIGTNDDPFYDNQISDSCLAFVERVWDWSLANSK